MPEQSDSRVRQLAQAYWKALPAAALTTAASFPKGWVEETTAQRVGKRLGVSFPASAAGRGFGRMSGAALGYATMPLFLSGLRDLKSDNPDERKRGLLKILATSSTYGAGKGALETYGAFRRGALDRKALGRAVRSVAGVRATGGVIQTLLLARAIARGQQKGKDSPLRAAALGGMYGFLRGAAESPLEHVGYRKALQAANRKYTMKRLAARGLGRGASGVIGGLVLDQIAKRLLG